MGVKKKVGAQAGKAALESGVLARGAMMISTKALARPSGLPLSFLLTDSVRRFFGAAHPRTPCRSLRLQASSSSSASSASASSGSCMEGACEGILSTKDSLFPTVSADWAVSPRESTRGALMGVEEQRESLKRLCPSPCEALSDEALCVSREARPVPRTGGTKTPCQIPLRRERPTAQCSTSLQRPATA